MNVDTLTIDPLLMNIVHRIAANSTIEGKMTFDGGVLIQGHVRGDVHVDGPLLIWSGATVQGHIKVSGDLYLFGSIGLPDSLPTDTILECESTAHVASSSIITGTLKARHLNIYQGADLRGVVRSYEHAPSTKGQAAPDTLANKAPSSSATAVGTSSSVVNEIESFFKAPGVDVPVFSR
ncbi:polymer-forming cytoskeletal protein [Hydrogenophaga bisanensis]|uniref:Polymer-forming cytoskeletal protein n=1 Tax=Hydrogenophaga bisanensis TaxID=439611 RepID=A0ABW2RDT4_9BURK